MNKLFSISGFLIFFTSSILAFLILKSGKSKLHRIWGVFNITISIWGLGAFFIGRSVDPEKALFWWKFAHIGIILLPVLIFHTITLLCELRQKVILRLIYIETFVFILLDFINPDKIFLSGVRYVFSFYYGTLGPAYDYFFVLWLIIVFVAHFQLLLSYRKYSGIKKTQMGYLLFATFLGFVGGFSNFITAYRFNVFPYGNFGIPLYCLIVTYAILRYRIMNLSLIITRTIIFVTVYSLILCFPFIIATTLKGKLIGFFGADKWWWAPMGMMTVLATVGPFIYIFIEKKAEERLLREQRQYQNTLRQASSGMIRVREIKRLLNLIVHVVTRTVKLEFAAIYLFDTDNNRYIMAAKRDSAHFPDGGVVDLDSTLIEKLHTHREPLVYEEVQLQAQDNPRDLMMKDLEQQLKEIRASVVIPSYVGNKMVGFIVLGKKKTGKIYSQDDLNVFSVLANQAALAIENAQFYEDIKETQEQLFQAEKMATIGTMADGLSHQINNRFQALSLISGDSLDILKTTDVASCSEDVKDALGQLKHAFERVQSNVKQGGEIVRGLLKYSRPGESGFEFIDFNRVIDGALEMAQYKVRLSELNIQRDLSPGLPKIRCNLTQLEEIFFNLVDNAYDAIKERQALNKDIKIQGEIKISAQVEDGHVRILFRDNGIGIKDKDKEKLFTPFFTTKATMKKGTGLGLYVIQKIVSFHEGSITIDSTYNKGTTFEILLPIAQK